MSIRVLMGTLKKELGIQKGEPVLCSDGAVLSGSLSVEEAREAADRKARRGGERYGSVGNYDPVLRAHCRLDREG